MLALDDAAAVTHSSAQLKLDPACLRQTGKTYRHSKASFPWALSFVARTAQSDLCDMYCSVMAPTVWLQHTTPQ